jgi:selenide,water dikinase
VIDLLGIPAAKEEPHPIGIVTTAAKQGKDTRGAIGDVVNLMTVLNRAACEAMISARAHAATDVTGFGLLGHLRNMTVASGVEATIELSRVPILDAARTYVAEGIAPGGTHANLRYLRDHVTFDVAAEGQLLLCDAQTSGGLLIALPASAADALIADLKARGTPCAERIGRIDEGRPGHIRVVP